MTRKLSPTILTMVTITHIPVTKSLIVVGAVVACGTLFMRYQKLRKSRAAFEVAKELLSEADDLAEDHVEVASNVQHLWELDAVENATEKIEGEEATVEASVGAKLLRCGTVNYDPARRECRDHYKVNKRVPYMRTVVSQAKARFGRPNRNAANVLAIRKFVNDLMERHKVRPTHRAAMVPIVVECVFMESSSEKSARELAEACRQWSGVEWVSTMQNIVWGLFGTRYTRQQC